MFRGKLYPDFKPKHPSKIEYHRIECLTPNTDCIGEANMKITVEYTDGTNEVFPETSAPGGSYCTTGKAEMGWYTVQDAYGNKTHIPAERIKSVKTTEGRRW